MKELLIGITGKAGAGKDTAGLILSKNLGYQRIAFADPIRDAVKGMLSLQDYTLLIDRELKEVPIDYLGKSPRQIMQLLGTEFGRNMIHSDIWVHLGLRRAHKARLLNGVVFTDVRFNNEAEAIKHEGGFIIEIVRDGIDAVNSHVSEQGVDNSLVDVIIYNNQTCEALQHYILAAIGYFVIQNAAKNSEVVLQPGY